MSEFFSDHNALHANLACSHQERNRITFRNTKTTDLGKLQDDENNSTFNFNYDDSDSIVDYHNVLNLLCSFIRHEVQVYSSKVL